MENDKKIDLRWLGTKPTYYGINGEYLGKKPTEKDLQVYRENTLNGKYPTSGMG